MYRKMMIRIDTVALFAAVGIVAAGCAKDPSKSVPAAQVAESARDKVAEQAGDEAAKAPAAEPTAAEPAAAEPAAVGAGAGEAASAPAAPAAGAVALTGFIGAVGSKVTGSHELKFATWQGAVELADGKAEGGSLSFDVEVGSVIADWKEPGAYSAKLEGHLKGADFFDVEKFPKATFKSTAISAGGEGASHTITGDLTLRGVTKQVRFPATITVAADAITGKAEFSINRKDFGIVYAGKADDLIRDGVVLQLDLTGTRG